MLHSGILFLMIDFVSFDFAGASLDNITMKTLKFIDLVKNLEYDKRTFS